MREYTGSFNAEDMSVAIVISRHNEGLSKLLLEGAVDCLRRHGIEEEEICVAWVPGCFEIPLIAGQMAFSAKFDAVICLGSLIRSEMYDFKTMAMQTAAGISHASLESGIPVIFGVLTTDSLEQAFERSGTTNGNKGFEAAMKAIEMFNLNETLFLDLYENEIADVLKDYQEEEEEGEEIIVETPSFKNGKKLKKS